MRKREKQKGTTRFFAKDYEQKLNIFIYKRELLLKET